MEERGSSQTTEVYPTKESIVCIDQESRIKGIPASPGIAIGKSLVLKGEGQALLHFQMLDESRRPKELQRYENAVRECVIELQQTYQLAEQEIGNVAAILETYEFIINDFSINEAIKKRIAEGFPAESALTIEYDVQKNFFKHAKDVMLRERAHDIENVKERLLQALHNRQISHAMARHSIVIAPSIIPQDVILFNESEVLAFVTDIGGIASHSCILARSLGIPAVIGVKDASNTILRDSIVIVDGYEGLVIANPKPETIEKYQRRQQEQDEQSKLLGHIAKLPAETQDGHRISLLANIDSPDEAENALLHGAEGVGLVRTEMLLVRLNHFPSEQEQFEWYSDIAERIYPFTVTLRAFDLGSDKYIEGLPHESNPALGMRGIRFLLNRKDIFRIQIRAILRASLHKNVRLMLPMIARVSEIEDTLAIIAEEKHVLQQRDVDFDPLMPIGMMIETPSAALLADKFAEMVDFFSIGTNDLTQYTLAADRINEMVGNIFDSFNPAVLRLMKQAVHAAKHNGIKVSVCGEFGGHSAATELLLGMGVDELSVAAPLLPELKQRIRNSQHIHAVKVFEEAMECLRPSDVRKKVEAIRKQS